MARFIARYAKYRHGIRNPRLMVLADGQRQELVRELWAIFETHGITPEEQELGITHFVHRGLPEDRDTEMLYSPRSRISVFDSVEAQKRNEWSDEDREYAETVLRASPDYGTDFLEVTKAPAPKPWPSYDEMVDAEATALVAQKIGVSLESVLAYERENANREEFIETLAEALAGSKEEDEDALVIQG